MENDPDQDVEAPELERRRTGRMWTRGAYIRRWEEGTESSVDLADLGIREVTSEGRMLAVRNYFDIIPEGTIPKGLDWARDVLCVLRREGLLIDEDPQKGGPPSDWRTRRRHFMPNNFIWMPKPKPPLLPPPLLLPPPPPPLPPPFPPPPASPLEPPITNALRPMGTDPSIHTRNSRATKSGFRPVGSAASTASGGAFLANPNPIHPSIHLASRVHHSDMGFPSTNPAIYAAGLNTRSAPQRHINSHVVASARSEPATSVVSEGLRVTNTAERNIEAILKSYPTVQNERNA